MLKSSPEVLVNVQLQVKISPGGGGVLKANGDVLLDGVAFSIELLELGRKFSDFWGK